MHTLLLLLRLLLAACCKWQAGTWQAAATIAAVRAASGKSPQRRRYINRLSPLLSDEAGKTIEQSIYGLR